MSKSLNQYSQPLSASGSEFLPGWLQFCGALIVFVGFVLLFSLWPDERTTRMMGNRVIIPALLSPVIGVIMGSVFFGLAATIQEIRKVKALIEGHPPPSQSATGAPAVDTSTDKEKRSISGTSEYDTPTEAALRTTDASPDQKSADPDQTDNSSKQAHDTPREKPYDVVAGVAVFQNVDGSFSVGGRSFANIVDAYSAARNHGSSSRFRV